MPQLSFALQEVTIDQIQKIQNQIKKKWRLSSTSGGT
jgi:hypothetical protein